MKQQMLLDETDLSPDLLKSTQEWFASLITYPLDDSECIQQYSPTGFLVAEEACRYIIPSPTLRPHQRIQIYNQQYWWRLLNALHTNFPLVTRLFGRQVFNEKIGIPFLLKYPPNHWSLAVLGERLPQWVSENYVEPDQKLVHHAANLDWAFTASFINAEQEPIDLANLVKGDPENLLNIPFHLQPHLFLFSWDYDLLSFREHLLKQDADYWVENPFPALQKGQPYRFVLFRNSRNNPAWRELTQGEYFLLNCFHQGSTMAQACATIENGEPALFEAVEENLQGWVIEWTQLGWLFQKPNQDQDRD